MVFSITNKLRGAVCNGQLKEKGTHTIKEFLGNKEFGLVNQDNAFSKVFAANGNYKEGIRSPYGMKIQRSLSIGLHAMEEKFPTVEMVLYPFITVDGYNKGFTFMREQ